MSETAADSVGMPKGAEVFIVATDDVARTLTDENGITYHQRADHFWSSDANEHEGSILWQGSAFHGHGIRLKPLYVMRDGTWVNVFTGKERKS